MFGKLVDVWRAVLAGLVAEHSKYVDVLQISADVQAATQALPVGFLHLMM
jgi:hypothetical protein